MAGRTSTQHIVFAGLLLLYAALAFAYIFFTPLDQLIPVETTLELDIPRWLLGLANAGIGLVVYGLLGWFGWWLARRAELPGIFREGAGAKDLLVTPAWQGLLVGAAIALIDHALSSLPGHIAQMHPPFPGSLVAAGSAAIGEEILYRLFLVSLWAYVLHLVVRRLGGNVRLLWVANLMAALAFAAGHIPGAMLILGAITPVELPAVPLAEIIVLNTLLGLAAGRQQIRSGLVAAVGVHFWADIVLHVLSPIVLI